MDRKMYEPTAEQEAKWATLRVPREMTDDNFKALWAKKHGGKTAGWGMMKRDWVIGNLKYRREYHLGIWQGRVDAACGLSYSEERNENTYNLGYYRGYTDFARDTQGWDQETRDAFYAKYVKEG
jgi:hypothetical protein